MHPKELSYAILREYSSDHLELVDSKIRETVNGYSRSRNLDLLASCTKLFDAACHTIDDLKFLRQVEALFKKNSTYTNLERSKAACLESFYRSEEDCRKANVRLDFFYCNRDLLDPDVAFKMSRMETFIRRVLGDFRVFLNEIPNLIKITAGATSTSRRADSIPQLKMKTSLYCTEGAVPYLKTLYRFFGFPEPCIKLVDWNRVERVPKNWRTDRTIGCEPEGNLPLQLAFDTWTKNRLRKFGIDLSRQCRNQDKAKEASQTDQHCTVDHERASDTTCQAAVAWLFPYEWYNYLNAVRCPRYKMKDPNILGEYEKFSSMGNGSTFCIETLIFAAACYACGSKDFLVYGDDVILESNLFEDYRRITAFLGFSINTSKTFIHGPFRESCGEDFYNGINITPIYVRNVDERKVAKCHLINTLAGISWPGSRLEALLLRLFEEYKLPLVPYSKSTYAGVWCIPTPGVSKILKTKNFVTYFRGFVPRNKPRSFHFYRGYYLWFLSRKAHVVFQRPYAFWHKEEVDSMALVTSASPIFEHTYVRKWVRHEPQALPLHLYGWSKSLERLRLL